MVKISADQFSGHLVGLAVLKNKHLEILLSLELDTAKANADQFNGLQATAAPLLKLVRLLQPTWKPN